MKRLLLSIVLVAFSLNSYSQFGNQDLDTITFEKHRELIKIDVSQKNNIWQIGRPQKTIFDSAYSRPYAIVTDTVNPYPVNNISSFIVVVPGLNTPGKTWNGCMVPHISYWQKFDMDTLKDSGIIEISADKGLTWQPFSYYSVFNFSNIVTGNSGGWVQLMPDITPANYCSGGCHQFPTCDTALVRFTFYSDSVNTNKEGWMIDDIIISYYECEGINELTRNTTTITIHPNPANTTVALSYQLPQGENKSILKLYNTMGQLLESKTINNNNGTIEDNLSVLPGGIYYYTLSVDGVVEATNKLAIIK